jgi:hypothetical protein
MSIGRRRAAWVLAAVLGSACAERAPDYRGAGLHVDTLSTGDMVGVYRATLAGSFTLGDPSLSILVDPLLLPRTESIAGGDTLAPEVLSALRGQNVVQGLCKFPVRATKMPLICRADRAGYVVRFSPPYALGPDSVQVHLAVEQYAIPNGRLEQRLRFERAYHVVRRGQLWRTVREARMRLP